MHIRRDSVGSDMKDKILREEINHHTDEVCKKLHGDNSGLMKRLDDLEENFRQHRDEVRSDIKELFGHLFSLKDLLQAAWWKLAGVICTMILILAGAIFAWLWDNEQNRQTITLENSRLMGETIGVQREMSENVREIRNLIDADDVKRESIHEELLDTVTTFLNGHVVEGHTE